MHPVIFTIFGAVAFGVWTIFHKFASPHIDQVFGAIVVSAVAVLAGLAILIPRFDSAKLFTDSRGPLLAAAAGLAAFSIDYFVLKAYSGGLPVTIGGPIIIGGSIAVAAIIGFFWVRPFRL